MSELSGQFVEVIMGDSTATGGYEQLVQLVPDCWMSLAYLQRYFMPEILNRI